MEIMKYLTFLFFFLQFLSITSINITLRDEIICKFRSSTNIPDLKFFFGWEGWECDDQNRAIKLCTGELYWTAIMCSGENITQLLFEHKDVKGTLPDEFSLLSELVWIDFTSNSLTGTIPESYGKLTNLVELTLGENQLTGTIPSSLGNLTKLLNLELSENPLTGTLPSSLGQLTNMMYFTISETSLRGTIPSGYGSLVNMERFELSKNSISGSVPETLTMLHKMELLYLENNHLTSSVPWNVSGWSSLRMLSLENNQMTGSLPLSFLSLKKLKIIRFFNNFNVSSANIQELCEDMKSIEVIEVYDRVNECYHPAEPIEIDPGNGPAWNQPNSSIFPLILVVSGILFIVGIFALDHHCREKKNYIESGADESGNENKPTSSRGVSQNRASITRNPIVVSPTNSYSRALMYGDDDEEEDFEMVLHDINYRRADRNGGMGSLSSLTHRSEAAVSMDQNPRQVELGLRMSLEAVVDRSRESDRSNNGLENGEMENSQVY